MLRVVEPSAVAAVAAVPVVGLLWVLLPGAGAALFAALLLCATVVPWLSRSMARRFEARQADLRGELTASVVDLIEGGDELTAFGANDRQLARISGLDAELTAVARSAARTAGLGSSLTTLLIGLAVVGSLALGIQAVRDHRLAGVVLATVVLVPLAALDLVSGLPVAAQVLQRTRNAGARVWAVMRAPDPVAEAARPLPVPPPPHRLRARGVRGGYPDRGDVLHGVDIDVEAGRRVAVIGPSGAGKSTLALVLLRLLSRTGGTVELDGVDVDDLAGDDLRRVVGMVAQDAHVFDTTVAENLRLAAPRRNRSRPPGRVARCRPPSVDQRAARGSWHERGRARAEAVRGPAAATGGCPRSSPISRSSCSTSRPSTSTRRRPTRSRRTWSISPDGDRRCTSRIGWPHCPRWTKCSCWTVGAWSSVGHTQSWWRPTATTRGCGDEPS